MLGLAWAGKGKDATEKAMKELLAKQRPDGGWSISNPWRARASLPGNHLFALQTAGLPASDAAYQRGVKFLLSTQQEDGSWYVSRARWRSSRTSIRLPPRFQSVDFRRWYKLGNYRAVTGFPVDRARIWWTIERVNSRRKAFA